MIIVLKKESLETGHMAFTLAQLEALEICLKEAEEKAKSLSKQVIPVVHTGNICSLGCSRTSVSLTTCFIKTRSRANCWFPKENGVGGGCKMDEGD